LSKKSVNLRADFYRNDFSNAAIRYNSSIFLNENLTNDDFFERYKTCTIRNQSIKKESKMKTKKMKMKMIRIYGKGLSPEPSAVWLRLL